MKKIGVLLSLVLLMSACTEKTEDKPVDAETSSIDLVPFEKQLSQSNQLVGYGKLKMYLSDINLCMKKPLVNIIQ
ncbi:hypothetical protein [Lysinibacillus antri]|uniref:Uncharacterized protein n=1 Tax=Lysinibacillus antri TaxID=2498145 RepID=A0A432LBG9_9BACI|nr:hypothetical protein [Lysinibacillus antri]RUL51932.1 hypothetical protein EK386_11365 [Lysinibacillus antri]